MGKCSRTLPGAWNFSTVAKALVFIQHHDTILSTELVVRMLKQKDRSDFGLSMHGDLGELPYELENWLRWKKTPYFVKHYFEPLFLIT